MALQSILQYLRPWDFSPTVLLACTSSAVFYIRGMQVLRRRGAGPGIARPLAFFAGLILMYVALQTYFDYLSQHMFWVHRLQHLVLHHIAPFLLAIAVPSRVLASGVPPAWRAGAVRLLSPLHGLKRLLAWMQGPVLAPLLFVGLIYLWLTPHVHFMAMLNANLYRIMNWSMAIDGIFFWWLILTPRQLQGIAPMGYGVRILILVVVTLLQILLGAYIFMHKTVLFDVYAICGRAWAISPLVDQQLGGLLTWVPPAMMDAIAFLLVLRMLLYDQGPRVSAAARGQLVEAAEKP